MKAVILDPTLKHQQILFDRALYVNCLEQLKAEAMLVEIDLPEPELPKKAKTILFDMNLKSGSFNGISTVDSEGIFCSSYSFCVLIDIVCSC